MPITIGSNIASLQALRRLGSATRALSDGYARLASGSRLNNPSDDAAGLAVASALNMRARVYNQAIRNVNDSFSLLNVAQGALGEFTDTLIRIKELAQQSANGTLSLTQRRSLDGEAAQLSLEINRITEGTAFNGLNILSRDFTNVISQLGFGTSDTIGLDTNSGLRRNIGTGFISTTQSASVTEGGSGLATGDFNGDGKLDLVTSDVLAGAVYANYGNGDGTFSGPTLVGGSSPTAVVAADFDGDGMADIAFGDSGPIIRLFRGTSAGLVAQGSVNTTVSGTFLKAGDVNNDGRVDLVAGQGANAQVVTNNGGFSFTARASFSVTSALSDFDLGDIDGDGKIDLVTTHTVGNLARVFGGGGDGSFALQSTFTAGNTAKLAVGDLNFDGFADIVLGAGVLRRSNGDFSFTNSNYAIGDATFGTRVQLADINNDGLQDIVRGGTSMLEVSFGRGDGTFNLYRGSSIALTGRLATGDFNGDGVHDVVNGTTVNTRVYLSQTEETTNTKRYNLLTAENARAALVEVDSALLLVQNQLGLVGAAMSRLQSGLGTVTQLREGYLSAESRIKDVDVAAESANVVRNQILQQTAAAVLAQSNRQPTIAVTLLRN